MDDYFTFCEERGEAPDKPFPGCFGARISPELHHKLTLAAAIPGYKFGEAKTVLFS